MRGTVINSVTREPVARALVSVAGEAANALLTDSEGRFEFPNVPAGRCIVQARRPGFFGEGPQREAFRAIQAGPKSDDVVLTLNPAGSITGQVTLSTSDPASNIQVQLMRRTIQEGRAFWQAVDGKSTNSEGIFRFGNLQQGEYKLHAAGSIDSDAAQGKTATSWGFAPTWYPDANNADAAGVLNLGAGQQLNADFVLTRQAFYSVTILVANKLQPGTGFQILDQAGHFLELPVVYNPQQQLAHTYLPNGSYTLIGTSNNGPKLGFGSTEITVRSAPVNGLSIAMLPVHPVPVTIRKEFTAPDTRTAPIIRIENGSQVEVSQDVNLMLFSGTDNGMLGVNLRHAPGSTDGSAWILENVLPGRYWVLTYASQGYVASITAGGADLTREPLVIGPGGASAPIEIVLRNDTASLSVRLKDVSVTTGDQSPGAFLYLLPQFDLSSVVPQSMPLSQASQEISNLRPGTYHAIALDRAFDMEYRNPKALEPYLGKGQTVTLEPGGTAHIDLDVTTFDATTMEPATP